MDELVAALKGRGYWIAVETNGTNGIDEAPWLAFVDYIACSPKAERPESLRLARADEVRVVARSGPGSRGHLAIFQSLRVQALFVPYHLHKSCHCETLPTSHR